MLLLGTVFVVRMTMRGAAMIAIVVAFAPAAARAAPAVDETLSKAQQLYESALAEVDSLHRIHQASSSRLTGAEGRDASSGKRNLLFKRALEAERALSIALKTLSERKARYDEALIRKTEDIDRQSRALLPELRSGRETERKRSALRLRALQAERAAHTKTLTRLRTQSWKPRPAGLPADRQARADLLEDMADKLRKRARKVRALWTAALDEQALRSASARLRQRAALFGESARPDRVLRSQGSGGSLEATTDDASANPVSSEAGDDSPPASPGMRDGFEQSDPSQPAPSANVGNAGGAGAIPPRDLGALLAADPELISPSSADPKALEDWLHNLELELEAVTSSIAQLRAGRE